MRRDFRTDVAVVGAGISGALMAYALSKRGYRVAVLDRRGPLRGSTPASTALLQFEIDTPLIHLGRRIGSRKAERAWLRSRDALVSLRALIRSERIGASFVTRPSVYLSGNLLDARGLEREARARRRIGLPAEYLRRGALRSAFAIGRSAGIASTGNAEVNPRALTSAVLRRARFQGAKLYAPAEVKSVHASRRRVLVETRTGVQIEARHIVFCTGYESLDIVPSAGHSIASTWVMATRTQPSRLWPERALIWEASEPYVYMRSTLDGRVICGGEDEPYADEKRREAATAVKVEALQAKLERLVPAVDSRARFRWSGSFGQTPTGLPLLGEIPGWKRCYAVMGYGGNGITFSMLAAEIVTNAISGEKDPDSPLFAFP